VVLEIAQFAIVPGAEEAFAQAYRRARHLVAATPGCRSMRMTRGVEDPSRFVLLTEWDSVEAHEAFRASDRFAPWRAEVGPHFAQAPVVAHVVDLQD